jgi:hypothetical protein
MTLSQGCVWTVPSRFNICRNKITQLWQQTAHGGIQIINGIKCTDCADGLVLTAASEDAGQRSVTALSRLLHQYNMKISGEKTESMGLRGKWWRRLEVNDTIIKQISSFNYLGFKISDNLNQGVESKL